MTGSFVADCIEFLYNEVSAHEVERDQASVSEVSRKVPYGLREESVLQPT